MMTRLVKWLLLLAMLIALVFWAWPWVVCWCKIRL